MNMIMSHAIFNDKNYGVECPLRPIILKPGKTNFTQYLNRKQF